MRPLLIILMTFLILSACGGGGGASENEKIKKATSLNPNAQLSVSDSEIEFNGEFAVSSPPNQSVIGSVTDFNQGTLHVKVIYGGNGLINIGRSYLHVYDDSATLELVPSNTISLGPGVFKDTITIHACNDSSCTSHIKGSPAVIDVTYKIDNPGPYYLKALEESLLLDDMVDLEVKNKKATFTTSFDFNNLRIFSSAADEPLEFTKLTERQAGSNSYVEYQVDIKKESGLESGTHDMKINYVAEIYGHDLTLSIPTQVNISPKLLQVSQQSIAFSQFQNIENLSKAIYVEELTGSDSFNWTAQTNVDWLEITEQGDATQPIQVKALPEGLAFNKLHYAKLTVTSDDPDINNSQTVNIALWIGDNELDNSIQSNESSSFQVMDPLRPYIYSYKRIGGEGEIKVFNYYSGLYEENIKVNATNASIYDIGFSPSGSKMYVVHSAPTQVYRTSSVSVIDLFTREISHHWKDHKLGHKINKIISPIGEDVLITDTTVETAFDLSNGKEIDGYYDFSKHQIHPNKTFSDYCRRFYKLICGKVKYSIYQKRVGFEDKIELEYDNFPNEKINSYTISPNGRTAAVLSENTLTFINTKTGKILNQYDTGIVFKGSNFTQLEWSTDYNLVVTNASSPDLIHYEFDINGRVSSTKVSTQGNLSKDEYENTRYSPDGLFKIIRFDNNELLMLRNKHYQFQ